MSSNPTRESGPRYLLPSLGRAYAVLEPFAYPLTRCTTAAILLVHGAARLRIIDVGGPTMASTTSFMSKAGIEPAAAFTWYVTLLEFAGGLLLFMGLFTRPVALLLSGFLTVGTFGVLLKNGFFVQGHGQGSGFEYSLVLLALALSFLIRGGGRYSVDRHLGWEL